MATNISTVGATARDHATITIWEAATDPASGDVEVGDCYDDANFDEHVTFAAPTTSATQRRILRAASGEEGSGTRAGAGVTVLPTSSGHIFTVTESHGTWGEGMLLELSGTAASSDECFRIGDSTHACAGTVIHKAFLWYGGVVSSMDGVYAGDYVTGSSSEPITIRNCAISGFTRAGVHAQQFATGGGDDQWWNIVNCTITDCDTGIRIWARNAGVVVTMVMVNNIVGDTGTADYSVDSGSGATVTTNSAENWDERTEIPGKHTDSPMTLVTSPVSGTECIITTKYGNPKLKDQAENDVLDDGVGPASNALVPDDDYINNARAGTTCDPGCHQVTAVSGDHEETPAPCVVTLTCVDPVVASGQVETPAPCAVTLTCVDPVVGLNITLAPDPCAVTLGCVDPVVTPGTRTETPSPCVATITCVDPVVAPGTRTETPSPCVVTLGCVDPSVGQAVAADVCTVTLACVDPTVTTGTRTETPSPCVVTLTCVTVTVEGGTVVKGRTPRAHGAFSGPAASSASVSGSVRSSASFSGLEASDAV